jgi:hypothetical protein
MGWFRSDGRYSVASSAIPAKTRTLQSDFMPISKIRESDAGLRRVICRSVPRRGIDEAIKLQDKLLLILSEDSIASDWVEDEVNKAFAEERDRGGEVLFPVRIDDAVMASSEPWARKLRDQRNIGDFRKWKDHDAYQKKLERLLRDLILSTAKS